MKKQELIHLHGLLGEVRKRYENWEDDLDLEDYEDLGVKPTNIHNSKTDHKRAVFELTNGLNGERQRVKWNLMTKKNFIRF